MIRRPLAFVCMLALALTACSAKKEVERDTTPRGGTLRVLIPRDVEMIDSNIAPLDQDKDVGVASIEMQRCCLHRTLLNFLGMPTREGGAQLRPDLATRLPRVSADGLTWTFDIKRGIRYGPPLRNVEVTAADFVTAMRRQAKLGDPNDNLTFGVIQGFGDYAAGRSDTISGLEAPDRHTLVVKLTQRSGDLGQLFTAEGTAPIPPLPGGRFAPFGVADGLDAGAGGFLPATGPYMLAGSASVDLSVAPAQRRPPAGFDPARSFTLVRNPSWRSATDPLRPAYVDRIEVSIVDGDAHAMVTEGKGDVVLDFRAPRDSLRALAAKVQAQPSLGHVYIGDRDSVRYVSMNLAVPPFDDVAVRRAVNDVLDKAQIQKVLGGPFQGRLAGHIAWDSLEQNLLVSYDPYRTPQNGGDVAGAKQEMMRSRYDKNRDGKCDAAACRNIAGLVPLFPPFVRAAEEIARDLARIGIMVRVAKTAAPGVFDKIFDPAQRTPLALALGIIRTGGSLDPTTLFDSIFSRESIGSFNHSLLGATPAQLRDWGYTVRRVPAVDDRIDQCRRLTGIPSVRCWAALDQYLMEEVVPWAPLEFETNIFIVSLRVVAFSMAQFSNSPALDRIALKPGS